MAETGSPLSGYIQAAAIRRRASSTVADRRQCQTIALNLITRDCSCLEKKSVGNVAQAKVFEAAGDIFVYIFASTHRPSPRNA